MANKEIHYLSDNGTMFWPATTTTAIIDPTSREILSDILNKKVSVGAAGNITSTVLPPIILESITTVSTNLTINATLIGKTYFCPDLEKIRHFYALDVNQSFQTTPEDTDPSPEITYYDKETDKFYRWDAVNQEMIGVVTGGDNNIQEITWSALKTLRDGENLTPGQFYRITDYTCTTTQTNTQSAGHVFDIIVFALSGSVLSEEAWAIQHSGNTYFANSNLAAWELKYCLSNDTTRFKWADSTNGKGVIYYMKDEWENEAPYDFKNIQFKRQLTNGSLDTTSGTNTWCYTFNYWNSTTSASEDLAMYNLSSYTQYGQTDYIAPCIRNKLGRTANNHQTAPFHNYNIILSNIVFLCTEIAGDSCRDNYFEDQCCDITLGSHCHYNTLKNSCSNITFGNNCSYNSFSERSSTITLGENCFEISGEKHVSNINIADNCRYISIGVNCRNITLSKNYTYNLTVGDGNQYITVTSSLTPTNSENGALRKIYIAPHTNITTTTKTISHNSLGDTFLTTYKPANSVEISV